MANEKFTAAQMIEALQRTRGMVTYAADYLGCTYNTVRRYIDKYATVKAAYEDAKCRIADNVEMTLYDVAIGKRKADGSWEREPNTTALIFLAKTHPALRDRGYNERIDINMNVKLIHQVTQALEAIGEDPEDVFRRMIETASRMADGTD